MIMGDLRIIGLDDSVVTEEVADVVAALGGCKASEVKTGATPVSGVARTDIPPGPAPTRFAVFCASSRVRRIDTELGQEHCNLFNSWRTQNLLEQHVIELNAGICAISEPRHVPDNPFWHCSTNRQAAVFWRPAGVTKTCSLIHRAQDFVVIRYGEISIISCYISPNANRGDFLNFLDDLGVAIRGLDGRTIICGDYNSKSTLWGSPYTNARGESIEEWAENDLRLINTGTQPTCVRPQGSSIIDLTWSTADVSSYIKDWKVLTDLETLSDHEYISMMIGGHDTNRNFDNKKSKYPR
ncbi:reverse transcriptase [Lasius niger]|uniref:Reverse transcriptase n=1 Tax=Lasius niger TaxID=67767 RepID=A0A0J7K7M8_LASNI|nr:reverse transcriptase [Lasius niger]